MPFTFYPGQLDFLKRCAVKDHVLLGAATGCGKSAMSVALARLKLETIDPVLGRQFRGRVLITAPRGTVDAEDDDEGARRKTHRTGEVDSPECLASQWEEEIHTFAPGVPVHRLFTWDDYYALVRRHGDLPDGFYLTYYEAMWKNQSLEHAPESLTAARLARTYELAFDFDDPGAAFMPNPALTGDPEADEDKNPEVDMAQTVGHEQGRYRCVAAPNLATRMEADFARRHHYDKAAVLWDAVFLDEAHVICNLDANITTSVIRMQPRFRYACTATPIPNIVSNLFSIMGWLCVPEWYAGSRRNVAWPYSRDEIGRFNATFLSEERDYTAEEHKAAQARKGGKRWSGKCVKVSPVLSSPARLLKLLKPNMAYVSKADCNPLVVPCETIDVRVPMGAEQTALYQWTANKANVPGKFARIVAAKQLTWLRGVCADPKGFSADKRKLGAPEVTSNFSPKIVAALDIIHQCLDRGEQVTVICSRIGQTDELYFRMASALGEDKLSRIDSTISAGDHARQAARFKSGATRILFMGMKCAKAYSFPRCPNEVVLSLEYSYGSLEQARGRVSRVNSHGSVWRKGEGKTVRVWCILHKGTIEEAMFDIVATKADAAAICLQGRRVPRDYKPVDMEEVLSESLLATVREQQKVLIALQTAIQNGMDPETLPKEQTERELERAEWPAMRAALEATQHVIPWVRRKRLAAELGVAL